MATTTEQAMNGQVSLLRAKFHSKKVEYDVSLSASEITWENLSSKSRIFTTVPICDIIAVHSQEASGPQHHHDHGFQIHYIHKRPDFIWKPVSMEFTSAESAVIDQCCQKLRELHANMVFETDRPKKLLVYINPVSGGSRGVSIYRKYGAPLFRLAGLEVESIVTERAGHIREHIMEYDTTKIDGVVVVGGDGTFTEASVGLAKKKVKEEGKSLDDISLRLSPIDVPIGIIPAGTGQGNVKGATGTCDPTTAVLNIIVGHSYSKDAYTVHDDNRLLSIGNLVCGFGFYSKWIQASEANRWMGRGRYLWGLTKTLSSPDRFQAEVDIEMIRRNEDGSIDTENPERKIVQGVLMEVCYFVHDMATQTVEPGVMYLDIFHGQANRKKLLAHLSRLARLRKDTFDFDFIEHHEASQYRIILDRNTDSATPQDTAHGPLRTPTCVNIDGDAYSYSGSVLQIRVNANIIRLFGSKHKMTL